MSTFTEVSLIGERKRSHLANVLNTFCVSERCTLLISTDPFLFLKQPQEPMKCSARPPPRETGKQRPTYSSFVPALHNLLIGVLAFQEGQLLCPRFQKSVELSQGLLQLGHLAGEFLLGEGHFADQVLQAALCLEQAIFPLPPVSAQGLHLGVQKLTPTGSCVLFHCWGQRLHSAEAARTDLSGIYQLL